MKENEMASFKEKIKAGEIKRADAMKVQLDDIHEEPGFNLRREGDDLEASITALADYILAGGFLPPLEVRPRDEGGVWIVDGHRRTRAYRQAVERGAPIEWIEVRAFTGNDIDRVTRVMTSAEQRPLSPLETAAGYKRLAAFNLSPDDIAARVGKTRQHVDQLLILANANADVQQMVDAGTVSATLAIDTVRKHGEKAGEFLRGKGAGNGRKVTAGSIGGKALPRKVVDDVVGKVEAFASNIPASERAVIFGKSDIPGATVVLPASMVRELIAAQTSIADARDKQAEKARNKAARAAQQELPA